MRNIFLEKSFTKYGGETSHRPFPEKSKINKKAVLRNFTKFIGKHLCQSLFFNKVAGLRPAILLKKRLWYRCFPVNFVKFLRTPFYAEHLLWLLLTFCLYFIYSVYLERMFSDFQKTLEIITRNNDLLTFNKILALKT